MRLSVSWCTCMTSSWLSLLVRVPKYMPLVAAAAAAAALCFFCARGFQSPWGHSADFGMYSLRPPW